MRLAASWSWSPIRRKTRCNLRVQVSIQIRNERRGTDYTGSRRNSHAADAVRAESFFHDPSHKVYLQRVVNGPRHAFDDQPLHNRVVFVAHVICFAELVVGETGFPLVEGRGGDAAYVEWAFRVAFTEVPQIGWC